MFVVGLIIAVVAAAFGAGVLVGNREAATLDVFGLGVSGFTGATVFAAGLVTMLVLLFGLWLAKRGTARAWRRGREVRQLRRQAEAAPEAEPAGTEAAPATEPAERVEPAEQPAPTSEPDPADVQDPAERPT